METVCVYMQTGAFHSLKSRNCNYRNKQRDLPTNSWRVQPFSLCLSLSLCFVFVIVISTKVVPSATTISATKWRHYNNRNRNTKAPLINSEPSTGAIHHARRYEFSQVCNAIANWRWTLLGWETQSDRNSWLDFLLTLSLSHLEKFPEPQSIIIVILSSSSLLK